MLSDNEIISRFLQEDRISEIKNKLGNEEWTLVYDYIRNEEGYGGFFCALIPIERVKEVIERLSWDISVDTGRPGCNVSYEDGQRIVTYNHFTQPECIMPLVINRTFHDVRPDYIEILEEFRLFHNLYHDIRKNVYISISDDGQEEEVIRVTNLSVQIKTWRIKQFLAIKEIYLAIYFEFVRYSSISLEIIEAEDRNVEVEEDLLHYIRHVSNDDFDPQPSTRTFSRLLGKKLIKGMEITKSGIWPFEKEREDFVDYIIEVDGDGNKRQYNSKPELLANYFGANPGAPHYLTPVFFRHDVLTKYYSNPEKYTVEDGLIRCGSLWCLLLQRDLPERVQTTVRRAPAGQAAGSRDQSVRPDS